MAIKNITIEISSENEGHRIDQFLAHRYPDLSRAYLQKQIQKEQILLNQRPTRKGQTLETGDHIQIIELLEIQERKPKANSNLPISIHFEDSALAVIEKPAGISTHPINHEETDTIVNWWIAKNPQILNDAPDPLRAGIVHRLDRDTSGLLLLSKNQEGIETLQDQFRKREVKKEYFAMVLGEPSKKGTIDFPLAHDPKSKRRMKALTNEREIIKLKARKARTDYWVEESFSGFSFLRVKTYTGRMHQIRVHLAALGFPLLGDFVYGKRQNASHGLKTNRHFLHACHLSFVHPNDKKRLDFSSPLPEDLKIIVDKIRKK